MRNAILLIGALFFLAYSSTEAKNSTRSQRTLQRAVNNLSHLRTTPHTFAATLTQKEDFLDDVLVALQTLLYEADQLLDDETITPHLRTVLHKLLSFFNELTPRTVQKFDAIDAETKHYYITSLIQEIAYECITTDKGSEAFFKALHRTAYHMNILLEQSYYPRASLAKRGLFSCCTTVNASVPTINPLVTAAALAGAGVATAAVANKVMKDRASSDSSVEMIDPVAIKKHGEQCIDKPIVEQCLFYLSKDTIGRQKAADYLFAKDQFLKLTEDTPHTIIEEISNKLIRSYEALISTRIINPFLPQSLKTLIETNVDPTSPGKYRSALLEKTKCLLTQAQTTPAFTEDCYCIFDVEIDERFILRYQHLKKCKQIFDNQEEAITFALHTSQVAELTLERIYILLESYINAFDLFKKELEAKRMWETYSTPAFMTVASTTVPQRRTVPGPPDRTLPGFPDNRAPHYPRK